MLVKNKWEEKGLYIEFKGIVSAKEMLDSDKNYGDSRFDDLRYIIVNLSSVAGVKFDRANLEVKAAQSNAASTWNNRIKLIFVICSNTVKKEIEFYIEQMKQRENNWDLFIVQSVQEAREIISNNDSVNNT